MAGQETERIPTGSSHTFEVIAESDKPPWEKLPERYKELPVDGWKKFSPDLEWYYHVRGIKGKKGEEGKELVVLVPRESKWFGRSVWASVDEFKPSQIFLLGLLTEVGLEFQDGQDFETTFPARYADITTKHPDILDFIGGKGVGNE